MQETSRLRRLIDCLLDHDTYRLALLVMVVLRTASILNPFIGPFVKFTLIWSLAILVKDLFTERRMIVNRYRGFCYLFLLCYGITALVNRDSNFSRNIAMFCYIATNFLLMYSYSLNRSASEMKRRLLRFNHTFLIATFIGQAISVISFVLNIKFSYEIGGTTVYYGVYSGRLWGFYTNPNAASFFAVLNFMLMATCLLIYKKNVPKHWKRFYLVNSAVQLLVFFMSNSRGSVLCLSIYLVLLPLMLGIPKVCALTDQLEKRKLKQKIAAVCVVIPLALNGAHGLALDILPYCVIQTDFFSEQIAENMGAEFDENLEDNAETDLNREDYGGALGGRYYLWRAGKDMILDHPLFGVGSENVPLYAWRYTWRYYTNFGEYAYLPGVSGGLHNLLIQIAAASGLIGLAVFALFALLFFIRMLRYYFFMVKEKRDHPAVISAMAIAMVIIVRSMTDTGLVYGIYYMGVVFWMYLSFIMYYADTEFTKGPKPLLAMLHDKIFKRHKKAKPKIKA